PHSFERIYLNFSDPWPKARHAKRRLTYRAMLERFKNLLSENGKIEFKTDNRDLFDFSLIEFEESGYILENVTFDLHASEWAKDNIVTEYEANFSAKGFKINRLEAYLPNKS
ncbi:MAG: tRNA (guanosine(46)-N7)-methyltransferase TrmB, partial [Clostridia bacterium]|nr:tRNA (guanosine(46)-N7)-methyltransferase TrmB [Clostridia bacterium]